MRNPCDLYIETYNFLCISTLFLLYIEHFITHFWNWCIIWTSKGKLLNVQTFWMQVDASLKNTQIASKVQK